MPSPTRKRTAPPPPRLTASEQAKAATPNPQPEAPKHRGPDLRKRAARRPVVGSEPPKIKMADWSEPDMVNHPPHYKTGAHCPGCGREIEAIDIIEDMTLVRGTAVKYLIRAGEKYDTVEDLQKAIWYINREIAKIERRGEMG